MVKFVGINVNQLYKLICQLILTVSKILVMFKVPFSVKVFPFRSLMWITCLNTNDWANFKDKLSRALANVAWQGTIRLRSPKTSMWELKLLAGSTQLLEVNNTQRRRTENTSNEHLDSGFYAKPHWLFVIINWPMEPPWGRAWAPDCQRKNREITDTVLAS